MPTVGDIVRVMEAHYPPRLAESWDKVGLSVGDPEEQVTKVAFALDPTLDVVRAALDADAQMLITHHPLLLKGVNFVSTATPKGRTIHEAICGGLAIFSAHTNADSARPGVNDELARLVGITGDTRALDEQTSSLDKWGVQFPDNGDIAAFKRALFSAGAGNVGDYSDCAFHTEGTGQFLPGENSSPAIGSHGELETVAEVRIEFVGKRKDREQIRAAIYRAHPYEQPAYDCVETAPEPTGTGIGRIGRLETTVTFAEFAQRVADALPETAWGIRAAGDPDKPITTVAVASGSGGSFLPTAAAAGADVLVTSDLKHHIVDDHLAASDMCVIDTAHWASEFPWVYQAERAITSELDVDTTIITLVTDPWNLGIRKEK
ncbi:Nif3-like dinuclear metal center hexameric protein [Corynebacterium glucuronolyticum]|uniref:GTP cyclohydrolase 1 type 2 homolog n=2 Tax=Corynebacterium glucuronolyticum TaxID=39791 RepID=A0AAX1L666_9CORY|nr:Nif3-like dinuclear metal center hexameric protein [Corynebacterium glucuronolyticum]EEI62246.1 dinuclear metal center protein, YbgI family [Corynebacterium glucuronolyticum ATCC 51866]QRP69900.1 Nif3-like dinuclear metal center hexameric protein [Corynebacterium glucuronolyticum]